MITLILHGWYLCPERIVGEYYVDGDVDKKFMYVEFPENKVVKDFDTREAYSWTLARGKQQMKAI